MKILTANIALGLRDMNRVFNNMRGVATYHSWSSFIIAVLCPALRGRWGGPLQSKKRIAYLQTHENLDAVIRLIAEANPDIVILNEVVPEIHGPRLERALREMGFVAISYGLGAKYPDAHSSTLVATKEEAEQIPVRMPQLPYPGCGCGIASLRLKSGVSVIGAHMAFGGGKLWHEQLTAITSLVEEEQQLGNKVIFAGDCNQIEKYMTPAFSELDMISVNKQNVPTCPTSLPHMFQKSIDHIYVPDIWNIKNFQTIFFGSDHLALCVEVLA